MLAPEIVELARAVADRWAGTPRRRPARRRAAAARRRRGRASTVVHARRGRAAARRAVDDRGPGRRTPGERRCCAAWPTRRRAFTAEAPGPRAVWTAGPGADPAAAIARLVAATAAAGGRGVARGGAGRPRRRAARRRAHRRARPRATTRCSPPTSVPRPATAPSSSVRRGHVPRRGRHARRGLRPRRGPRPGRALGRRRRQPGRAARALLARARGARAALRADRRRVRARRRPSRSVEAAQLVASGWAREVVAAARRGAPARARGCGTSGSDADLARDEAARSARLPHSAWEVARAGLARGPVLVQVPRRGYVPGLACQTCREPARCAHCHGPLGVSSGHAAPVCGWCGRTRRRLALRAVPRHAAARDLGGRAAHGRGARPRLPRGAGPHLRPRPRRRGRARQRRRAAGARRGDARAPSPGPRAGTPPPCCSTAASCSTAPTCGRRRRPCGAGSRRSRWCGPPTDGGAVVLARRPGPRRRCRPSCATTPPGFAARELAEREGLRASAGLARGRARRPRRRRRRPARADAAPARVGHRCSDPSRRTADGPGAAGAPAQDARSTTEPLVRALVSVPRLEGAALAAALRGAAGVRSARKEGGPSRVRVDPVVLG